MSASSTPSRSFRAVRGRLLTFVSDPREVGPAKSYRYVEDGLLVVEGGRIARTGDAHELLPDLPSGTVVDHYPDCLVLPGLIDTHIHYPQTQVIASYGAQLLDWLQTYTFVEEQNSPIRRTPRASPAGSSTNCCATARPPPWSTAPYDRNRPPRSSPSPSGGTP